MSKLTFTDHKVDNFVRVLEAVGEDFRAVVAVHNTNQGPAMGGTRFLDFPAPHNQFNDTLMLAESMSYKHALADTGMGGGKATIQMTDNPDVWKLFAETMNYLNKDGVIHHCAGDMGTGDKLGLIAEHSDFVLGHTMDEPSGVATGYGVVQSMLGCHDFTGDNVENALAYVNGYGKVGSSFAEFARPHITHTIAFQDPNVAFSNQHGKVSNHLEFDKLIQQCTVFAPCALAHIVTPDVIDKMASGSIIVSGANNPEQNHVVCKQAHDKGILFPPAWVANAGGIIVICESANTPKASYNTPVVKTKLEAIRGLTTEILQSSKDNNLTPMEVALVMAREKLG